jgi:hypothetical protein
MAEGIVLNQVKEKEEDDAIDQLPAGDVPLLV